MTKSKSKQTKKTSGVSNKNIKVLSASVEEYRRGEKRIIQHMQKNRRVDPSYLRIPFTI